ncbi:dephospho-CoA kinase [Mariniphaga anaerophila]|uniref:Dephospho-CoA kinase n=1 Tax=Mariniphaga anaerophila TaxID=1484053 RepID=A0A1M5EWS7_9BACT|nr:dephospho-CoA kinase [Mariniphaga anaerophila]SHF83703.1 dephospho-CoA kinase [Mariniphaga anaerophila]
MTLAVGITGGIGSGKSTVCNVFRVLGVPVFEADAVAKSLYNTNKPIKSGLIHLFGESIYTPDGNLDRKKLASEIFNNDIQLAKVNELVHPVVRKEFENWINMQQNAPYIIHEAAILFESGLYRMMDFTLLVTAPEEQRVARVMARDNATEEMVHERMAKQWSEEKKKPLASKILVNDNKNLIIPEIIQIDRNLKEYGKIW